MQSENKTESVEKPEILPLEMETKEDTLEHFIEDSEPLRINSIMADIFLITTAVCLALIIIDLFNGKHLDYQVTTLFWMALYNYEFNKNKDKDQTNKEEDKEIKETNLENENCEKCNSNECVCKETEGLKAFLVENGAVVYSNDESTYEILLSRCVSIICELRNEGMLKTDSYFRPVVIFSRFLLDTRVVENINYSNVLDLEICGRAQTLSRGELKLLIKDVLARESLISNLENEKGE